MTRIKLELNKEEFKKKLDIKDGKTPTKKELIEIVKPLIPKKESIEEIISEIKKTKSFETSDIKELDKKLFQIKKENELSYEELSKIISSIKITTVNGGISDAPFDGEEYVRKNGDWSKIAQYVTNWGSITGNISDQTDLINLLYGYVTDTELTTVLSNYVTNSSLTTKLLGYVPFSGASQNVDLNNKAIVNVANLGIGTASPTYKLDVKGKIATDAISTDVGLNFSKVANAPAPTLSLVNDGGAGGLGIGTYYYTVTYVTALGETSGSNYLSSITTDATHKTVLLQIPISSDYRVTGRKIYRTIVNGTSYNNNLLATINNNTTTSFTDNFADSSLDLTKPGTLRTNTTSNFITSDGTKVLFADSSVTTLGFNAGRFITGDTNTAIGGSACSKLVNGNSNTAVGSGALSEIVSSSSNNAFGRNTLSRSTSGSNNCVFGSASFFNSINGSANIGIGTNTGFNNNGSYNVFVGFSSGFNNIGSSNVFLGNYSGYYETGSNKFIVDNVTRTNETNARQSALIYGEFNTTASNQILSTPGKFGIGTTSPDSNLHVVGSARITSTFNMGGTNYATNISTYSNGGTFTLQNRGAVNIGISGYNTIINSDNVGIGTTSPSTKLQVVGDVKIGEYTTNYAQFGTDGTLRLYGTATVFDDLLGDITGVKTLGTGVSVNAAESTLEYVAAANTSDYAYFNYQLSHKWKIGSVVHPHIHFEQNQNVIPNWLIQYRWQVQGQAKTTAWTNYKTIVPTFTYTTGTLNQIVHDSGITPPAGASLSDIIEIRIIRDTANTSGLFTGADTYTGVASITSADIHYEMDALGSNNEYTK